MTRLLQESLLWRLWLGFLTLCRQSCTARLLRILWNSRVFRCLRRASDPPSPTARSGFGHRLLKCGQRLLGFWRRLQPVWEDSCTGRLLHRLDALSKQSLLLHPLLKNGWTGLVLCALGLFPVLDWLLRDVLAVPILSSVWDEGLLLLALGLAVRRSASSASKSALTLDRMTLPLLQFFAISLTLLLLTLGSRPDISVSGFRATCQGLLWLPLLVYLLKDEAAFRRLYRLLILSAFAISLHGVWQYIAAVPIPKNWTDAAESAVRTRVFSIFGSPNILGDYLVLFTPMCVALAYTAKKPLHRLVFVLMAGAMLAACLFTMSRGAWVGMFAAGLVFALLVDLRLLLLMLAGCVLSLLLPFVRSRLSYLLTPEYRESVARAGRQIRREKALRYFGSYAHPLLGLGFGRFGGAIAMQNQIDARLEYFYTDNYYLKLLLENGYTGLISYLLLQLGLLWSGLCSWKTNRKTGCAPLSAGMLAGLTGVLVHCLFENIFEEPYMLVCFWVVAGLLVWRGNRKEGGA